MNDKMIMTSCTTAFLFVSAYLCIAVLVFRFIYNVNEGLKQSKHYMKHPERYGVEPTWILATRAMLWPLQIVGLLIYILTSR